MRFRQRSRFRPEQFPRILSSTTPCSQRAFRLRVQSLGRSWARAHSTVHPTPPVAHRRSAAVLALTCLRAAPRRARKVPGRIVVFQPTAPLRMGFIAHFSLCSPGPASPVRACRRRWPVHPCRHSPAGVARQRADVLLSSASGASGNPPETLRTAGRRRWSGGRVQRAAGSMPAQRARASPSRPCERRQVDDSASFQSNWWLSLTPRRREPRRALQPGWRLSRGARKRLR